MIRQKYLKMREKHQSTLAQNNTFNVNKKCAFRPPAAGPGLHAPSPSRPCFFHLFAVPEFLFFGAFSTSFKIRPRSCRNGSPAPPGPCGAAFFINLHRFLIPKSIPECSQNDSFCKVSRTLFFFTTVLAINQISPCQRGSFSHIFYNNFGINF